MTAAATRYVDWAHAVRPHPHEGVSGDACWVQVHPRGVLLVVADGLGHGPEAEAAARLAVQCLGEAPDQPLRQLLGQCHESLRGTRGVAIAVASLEPDTRMLAWAGVGNVTCTLFRAASRESLRSMPGVLGYRYSPPPAAWLPVAEGDLLLFATDGIAPGFEASVDRGAAPARTCRELVGRFAVPMDDALVLAARLFPPAPHLETGVH